MEHYMKRLIKQYDFNSDMQYFELIAESVLNGQRIQAIKQFKAMSKAYRIQFIKSVNGNWNSGLNQNDINMLLDNI